MRPSFALPFALLTLLTLLSGAAPPNKNDQVDYSTPYSRVLTGDTFKGATATGAWYCLILHADLTFQVHQALFSILHALSRIGSRVEGAGREKVKGIPRSLEFW